MPCLIGHFDPKRGLEIQVIETPPARTLGGAEVSPAAVPRRALLDTGTTTTIIALQLVEELDLQPLGAPHALVGTM